MIGSRMLGTNKKSDEDYWKMLINSKLVITTSNQIDDFTTDWAHINHLIYRYLEVPACGSTLVAQKVPGWKNTLNLILIFCLIVIPKRPLI